MTGIKPEIYSDIVRNALSAGVQITVIEFDTERLMLTVVMVLEPGSGRAVQYSYTNVYLGEWDVNSFMQHVRNIVTMFAKHHATLDTFDVERFYREVLF